MAKYDSDSSSDDGNDYTTTNVVLGYISEESSGDDISHVGGHPVWLEPKSTPPSSLVQCQNCDSYMSLLLQLNADLQQYFPNDQRRLHVWCCRAKTCLRKKGSIRAFREVKKGKTSRHPKLQQNAPRPQEVSVDLGNALFGGKVPSSNSNANPFSASATLPTGPANPFVNPTTASSQTAKSSQPSEQENKPLTESFAEKLKIGTLSSSIPEASKPWPAIDAFPSPFHFYYLDAYPEELDPSPRHVTEQGAESSRTKYELDDTSSSALDKDTFESTMDKTFQRFSDVVAQNSEQVLRYEFKGQPLLYSGSDAVAPRFIVPHGKVGAIQGIPRCDICRAQRVFEMQLMPNLIYEIEKDEALDIDNGMEWGAILVCTCENNCGEEEMVAFREEWVGVQWEERVVQK